MVLRFSWKFVFLLNKHLCNILGFASGPVKPEIFTGWPLTEKFADLRPQVKSATEKNERKGKE